MLAFLLQIPAIFPLLTPLTPTRDQEVQVSTVALSQQRLNYRYKGKESLFELWLGLDHLLLDLGGADQIL